MLQPGDVFAERFEIRALAGSGGMGHVYLAHDRHAQAAVALKLLAPGGEPFDAARFAREAQALSELRHPRIVRYLAHGQCGGGPWLAMEWLEGEDLRQRLARGPLALEAALLCTRRAAEALAAAHAHGIVHRDVKPGNLFLPGGEVDALKI